VTKSGLVNGSKRKSRPLTLDARILTLAAEAAELRQEHRILRQQHKALMERLRRFGHWFNGQVKLGET